MLKTAKTHLRGVFEEKPPLTARLRADRPDISPPPRGRFASPNWGTRRRRNSAFSVEGEGPS
jgi:hypothetical protein